MSRAEALLSIALFCAWGAYGLAAWTRADIRSDLTACRFLLHGELPVKP